MNKETFEALKFILHHSAYGGANDKEFWDNLRLLENYAEEVSKEYI